MSRVIGRSLLKKHSYWQDFNFNENFNNPLHIELFLLSYFADQFDDVNNGIMMPKGKSNFLEMFFEIAVIKHFVIFTGKQLYRDSNTGFFLWILWIFYQQVFLQNTSWRCFCKGVPLVFHSSFVSLLKVYNMRELIFLPEFQKETLRCFEDI